MSNDDAEPWDRQKGESSKAFEAFQIYRDAGAGRQKHAVAKELSKSRTLITRWAGDNDWDERVLAWEREQDRLWQAEQFEQRRKVAKSHARIANDILSKVARRLQAMTEEDVTGLTPVQLTRLFDSAVKAQRDAYGLGQALDLRHDGEVTTKHELDLASVVLADREAADLSLALAERLYGRTVTGEPGAVRAAGDE